MPLGNQVGTVRAPDEAGNPLARAYWPCLLCWLRGEPTDGVVERMQNVVHRWDARSMVVAMDRATQVLLLADDSPAGAPRAELRAAIASAVRVGSSTVPGARIRTVAGDRIAPHERLAGVAATLDRAARYAPARAQDGVVWVSRYSLAWLLERVDSGLASRFVDERLASLAAYDRHHGTNLQRVLELALDHHHSNTAAREAFMHRNTFRRQLRKALELVDVDLECPEERLSLHLALKMRASLMPAFLGGASPD